MKALGWGKMPEICFPIWLVWIPDGLNVQKTSHTEALHALQIGSNGYLRITMYALPLVELDRCMALRELDL